MAWCRPHDWSLASANVGAQTLLFLHIRHSKDQWQSKINNIRESTVWKKNIRNRWPHPLLRIGFCVCVGAGVPILRYINISILIKYSNFSRFYKKLGPFYKTLQVQVHLSCASVNLALTRGTWAKCAKFTSPHCRTYTRVLRDCARSIVDLRGPSG